MDIKIKQISRSREKLIKQLDAMGYEMNEHLVTPTQFGIPNDRARYYLSVIYFIYYIYILYLI